MLTTERSATIEELRARKLFKDIPINTIREVLHEGGVSILRLPQGAYLNLRRNNSSYVYIIISGYLELRLDSQLIRKGRSFLLGFRGPEQLVGEIGAVAKEPEKILIKAHESCLLMEIPSETLSMAAEMDGRIYRNIASLLMEKVFQERKRIEISQMPQGEAQVAQTLLTFLDERGSEAGNGKGRIIKGIIRQSDIADYIGCDRTTVAKRLSLLKKRGIIEYATAGRNASQRITIRNLEMLKKIIPVKTMT